jgi:hypothetical protein
MSCRKIEGGGRFAAGVAAVFTALLIVAGLCSCSPSAVLVIGPSSDQLRQGLSRLAAIYTNTHRLRIKLSDKLNSIGDSAIIIDWSFIPVKTGKTQVTISKEKVQESGFDTALAFRRWEEQDEGWRDVPILWDAWGIASSPGRVAFLGDSKTFEWKDRFAFVKAKEPIIAPAGDPGVRQSLFWLVGADLPEQSTLDGIFLNGIERTGKVGRVFFESFTVLEKDPIFPVGSTGLTKADVSNLARNSNVGVVFGNYQSLRFLQGSGRRDFRSVVYPLSQGYAMPVSILAARISGSGAPAARARDFLIWLISAENQKKLSDDTGYMAANFNADNLDLNALDARDAAIGALRIVPIDPEPLQGTAAESWASLLGRVLARPADWERVITEK